TGTQRSWTHSRSLGQPLPHATPMSPQLPWATSAGAASVAVVALPHPIAASRRRQRLHRLIARHRTPGGSARPVRMVTSGAASWVGVPLLLHDDDGELAVGRRAVDVAARQVDGVASPGRDVAPAPGS